MSSATASGFAAISSPTSPLPPSSSRKQWHMPLSPTFPSSALIPLVIYAVFGTSRALSVTTTSTIAILTASALKETVQNASHEALIIAATTLSCLVGIALLIASVLRLGAVANLISDSVLIGFKAGVGLTIVVDQIPKLLGITFAKGHLFHNVFLTIGHLPQASVSTVVFALAMLALQLGLQRFLPAYPRPS